MSQPKIERSTCIDWAAATLPNPCDNPMHLRVVAARATKTNAGDWSDAKPMNGYTMAVKHPYGLRAMSGRPDMGTHLIAPGSALSALRVDGLPSPDLVSHMLSMQARFARIDLALDVTNSRLDFLQCFREIEAGSAETQARAFLLVQSNENGWCLYVGSRTSDRFFRLYNKFAEVRSKAKSIPDCQDWVRFELSLSNGWARKASHMLDVQAESKVVIGNIRSFVFLPTNERWRACVSGTASPVARSSRKLGDTQFWLLNSVSKTLAREAKADRAFLAKYAEAVNKELGEDASQYLSIDDVGT